MHLVIFPLIIFLLATAPILLLWPERGLSGRNYWLAIGSALGGLVAGFALMVSLSKHVHVGFLAYAMFLVFPLLAAIVLVHKIGNKGRSVAKSESVILNYPSAVFNGFLFSTVSGLGVAILSALLLGIESDHLLMAIAVLLPIALFLQLIQANLIQSSTLKSAFKFSLSVAIALFLVSLLMGPYFIVGLPVVLYGLVASFVFLYVIYNHQKT